MNTAEVFLRLTVGKRSTLYRLIPLNPDPRVATRAWRVIRPGTGGKKWYDVGIDTNGYETCTCPDAVYRSRRCKHLAAIRALGLLVGRES